MISPKNTVIDLSKQKRKNRPLRTSGLFYFDYYTIRRADNEITVVFYLR